MGVGFTERDVIIRTRPQACLVQSNCDGKITQVESCCAPDVAFVDEQDKRQEKRIAPSADARTSPTTTCGCLCVDPILQLIMRRTSRKAQLTGSRTVPKASVQNSVIADSMVYSADAQREFNTACPLLKRIFPKKVVCLHSVSLGFHTAIFSVLLVVALLFVTFTDQHVFF